MFKNPTKTQAIKTFLTNKTHADLAELYTPDMEVQVNVIPGGTRIGREYKGRKFAEWTDGVESWKPFRIPHNAAVSPEYTDTILSYDLEKHVESIGLTGWDWKNQLSRWVAFDFDAIVGHSSNHGCKLTAAELAEIEEIVSKVPWITIRRSTGGAGLHLYVFFEEPVPTKNHTEHAALGRAILEHLSCLVGYDLEAQVDICGGNMWVWHRKMLSTKGLGLSLVRTGSLFPAKQLPKNWQQHLDVVSRRKNKTSFGAKDLSNADSESAELYTDQKPRVKLDEEHKRLIDYLFSLSEWVSYWNHDHWCLITHTLALKQAHTELQLEGVFETASSGSTQQNCFAYPCPRGAWKVVRFSPGVNEHPTWYQTPNGWTSCDFNKIPPVCTASIFYGGVENPKDGAFDFREAQHAKRAAESMGIHFDLPEKFNYSRAKIYVRKQDGKIVIKIDGKNFENEDIPYWGFEKGWFHRVFAPAAPDEVVSNEVENSYDDFLRLVLDTHQKEIGWSYKLPSQAQKWVWYKENTLNSALISRGIAMKDVPQMRGSCANNPWNLVCYPFEGEYPGSREWNRDSPQLAFPLRASNENLYYPTWQKLIDHIGGNLTTAVKNDPWCQENGILTGPDWLKVWCARLFQKPMERLPYLFLYSPGQGTGKTTFHEALKLLMYHGHVYADFALRGNFNSEIDGHVLCVIEETNLGADPHAYNRVKNMTTAPTISINTKGAAVYETPNTTHWVQCANKLSYCPIEPGDTRIVVILIDEIPEEDYLPGGELDRLLREEASDFLTELFTLELPDRGASRLYLPVIMTEEKYRAETEKETEIETFLRERCYYIPGNLVKLVEFKEKFKEYLAPEDRGSWSDRRISKEIPKERFPVGRSTSLQNAYCIGNLSLTPSTGERVTERYIQRGDKLELIKI